jgi:GNAT superfamily N-acetyltransferase
MTDAAPKLYIREANQADQPFIFQSWLKTYKHNSPFAKRITDKVYFARHHAVATRILQRATVFVACPEDSPETILGYLIVDYFENRPILHFMYVKDAFRGMGIASRLMEAAGLDPNECLYTHRTYSIDWIEKKFPGLVYDPYLI